jgi:hypothetical protein
MSTVEPPPRPAATTQGTGKARWVMTYPSIQGRELTLWRSITAALLVLALLAGASAQWGALALTFLVLVVAALVAEGQSPWWVRHGAR